MPDDLKLPEILGIFIVAKIPAANAATEAKTKAGTFPPPNRASHGPAPSDTIIYNQAYIGLEYTPKTLVDNQSTKAAIPFILNSSLDRLRRWVDITFLKEESLTTGYNSFAESHITTSTNYQASH